MYPIYYVNEYNVLTCLYDYCNNSLAHVFINIFCWDRSFFFLTSDIFINSFYHKVFGIFYSLRKNKISIMYHKVVQNIICGFNIEKRDSNSYGKQVHMRNLEGDVFFAKTSKKNNLDNLCAHEFIM